MNLKKLKNELQLARYNYRMNAKLILAFFSRIKKYASNDIVMFSGKSKISKSHILHIHRYVYLNKSLDDIQKQDLYDKLCSEFLGLYRQRTKTIKEIKLTEKLINNSIFGV